MRTRAGFAALTIAIVMAGVVGCSGGSGIKAKTNGHHHSSDSTDQSSADSANSDSSGRNHHSTSTTTPTTRRTPTVAVPSEAQACAVENSPADYDPNNGRYAAYVTAVDVAGRRVTYDVIQYFTGAAANAKFHEANPDAPPDMGAPGDYFIVNQSPATYTTPLATQGALWLLPGLDTSDIQVSTLQHLADELNALTDGDQGHPYWITIQNGQVTAICEEFVA